MASLIIWMVCCVAAAGIGVIVNAAVAAITIVAVNRVMTYILDIVIADDRVDNVHKLNVEIFEYLL